MVNDWLLSDAGTALRRLQALWRADRHDVVTAAAIEAFAPPMATFKRGRDFAAWLGLVPRQHPTGGKPRLGRTSKMGQRDIRRLLIIGAMTVVRWAVRKGAAKGRGWPECWPRSHDWWWPLPWPTRWLVRPGRCLARAKNIEDQRWRRPDRQALTLVGRR